MKHTLITRLLPLALLGLAGSVAAQKLPVFPSAQDTDPVTLGWMAGSPPPPDKLLRKADMTMYKFPQWRWTFSHARQFFPTVNVSRGSVAPATLPTALRNDLDGVSFTPLGRTESMTWGQAFDANYTDGVMVLHKGRVVYERYSGALTASGTHMAQSVTKSFTGTLAAMLVAEGKLDPAAPVSKYVPELKDSGFGDATVRDVMDMRVGIDYDENYASPKADIWRLLVAGGIFQAPPDYQGPKTFYEYIQSVKKSGEHGGTFAYKTVTADVLGWVVARASGQTVAQLMQDRFWSRMGMEQDGYYIVDSEGTPFSGGGLNLGLRDMARFGEMLRLDGQWHGQQIVPAAVIDDIRHHGDSQAFAPAGYATLPGWNYRSMWWVSNNDHGAYSARGIHGQAIYIDPKAQMVIARFASHPVPGNPFNDPTSLPAYAALADYLMAHDR